jgi:hypothetical protein
LPGSSCQLLLSARSPPASSWLLHFMVVWLATRIKPYSLLR